MSLTMARCHEWILRFVYRILCNDGVQALDMPSSSSDLDKSVKVCESLEIP